MEAMNAQAIPISLDQMFEALIDELEAATEIATRPDRNDLLQQLAAHCAAAALLTAGAIASSQ